MTIDYKIRDEKLQCDINREVAKISTLSSGKTDKYEYLTGEEILLSNQRRVIEQATCTYSPLRKAFEKQKQLKIKEKNKALEEHGEQLIKSRGEKHSLELLKRKGIFGELVNESRFEINKAKELILII